jgi:predicted metal-dependent hydrolase
MRDQGGSPVSFQLPLPWLSTAAPASSAAAPREIVAAGRTFPVDVVRHRWARRYLARLTEHGRVRLTVPRGASIAGGLAFVRDESAWIAREWDRLTARAVWASGTVVLWRGMFVTLEETGHAIVCGPETIPLARRAGAVRAAVERHWRRLAETELPKRCRELAALHGLLPSRVSVRDQRSRWGACSSRRSITLNWRLLQMPPAVSDYVILHELAHLEHPNHSRRFWRKVAAICPEWRASERWLRQHGRELF